MRTSVLYHTLAVALVVGAACKGPDSPDTNFNLFAAKLRAANVLPKPADTTAAATATVTSHPTDSTFSWTYNAGTVSGTIDSVALYTATSAATITSATAPSVLLCATAACTGSG